MDIEMARLCILVLVCVIGAPIICTIAWIISDIAAWISEHRNSKGYILYDSHYDAHVWEWCDYHSSMAEHIASCDDWGNHRWSKY